MTELIASSDVNYWSKLDTSMTSSDNFGLNGASIFFSTNLDISNVENQGWARISSSPFLDPNLFYGSFSNNYIIYLSKNKLVTFVIRSLHSSLIVILCLYGSGK